MDVPEEGFLVDGGSVALEGVILHCDGEINLTTLQAVGDQRAELQLALAVDGGNTCREVGLLAIERLDGDGDGAATEASRGLPEASHGVYHTGVCFYSRANIRNIRELARPDSRCERLRREYRT